MSNNNNNNNSNNKSPQEIETSQVDDRLYKSLTLPNGLECLLISDSTTDKSSAAMDVRVGHLSDPSEVPGLAHFCEHMLFLGTEKYPDENSYNVFLNQHGGSSNAFTDMESTNYFFDISHTNLEGALDRFAQFFIAPLFTLKATDREMQAVDSEHAKNLQNDMWRSFQLSKALCDPQHPFSKFGSGNLETLKVDSIRESLLKFHQTYYSANVMKLVVLGRESLEQLEEWLHTYFTPIANKNLQPPQFPGTPFGPSQLGQRVHVVPIADQRTVEMHFPLRELDTLYESKPTRYISHLLGHESAGSILSLLKQLGWANELSAGESRNCTDWSSFTVSVDLTTEGLQCVNQVVHIVFLYLQMLRNVGPQEWVHYETSIVADCNFRFLSKRPPMDYCSGLAGRMQTYPLHHVLSGPYKIYQYEPQHIVDILDHLVPSNLLLMISSKTFEGTTDLTEQWYGTNYSQMKIEDDLLQLWSSNTNTATATNTASDDEDNDDDDWSKRLTLPERNDMIATDFTLRSHDSTTFPKDEPRLLQDTPTLRLWYKPDNVFEMPKVNVMALLWTPAAYDSPEACVLSYLWVQILQEHCNEFTYLASMAGLHCDFSNVRTGIEVHLSGYNHKVNVLMERIVKTMKDVPTKVTSDVFQRIKDKVTKEYQNFSFAHPYQHAIYGGDLCVESLKWSMDDKIGALASATLEDVQHFAKRLLSRFKAEILIHGNVSTEEAKNIARTLTDGLHPSTPFPSSHPKLRVTQLKPSQDYVYRFPEFNEGNTNSCMKVVYQMGPMELPENACLALMHHLVKEPAFNELRTEEQLGYIVHTAVKTSGENVKGLLFLIQSDGFDPIHLDERLEAFLGRFRSTLYYMTPEQFESNVHAVVKNLTEKNKNMGEESSKYWQVVANQSYIFRKFALIGEEVSKITKDMALRFFDKYLAKNAPKRQKLSVQVFASPHMERIGEGVNTVTPESEMNNEDAEDDGGNNVVFIDNPVEFKHQMPLFPLAKSVNVNDMAVELSN